MEPYQPKPEEFDSREYWKRESEHYRELYLSAHNSRERLRAQVPPESPVPISLTQDQAEAVIGRKLPTELFQFVPLGHRIVVVREKPKTMHGKLHIPARSQTARAAGWVVAVGPDVGKGIPNWVGRWPWPREQLLGAHIVFGAYAGQALMIDSDSTLDEWVEEAGGTGHTMDDYLSPFKLMTDNELWGLINDPVTVPSPVEVWANSTQASEKEREEWQQQVSGPASSTSSRGEGEPGSASIEATGAESEPSVNRFDN